MSLNGPNQFPLPIGVTVSFAWGPLWQVVSGLYQSPNFFLTEKGLWTVTLNVTDAGFSNDQIILATVASGTAGLYNGTLTTAITMAQSGYFSLNVPPGGQMYAFTTVNPIKIAGCTIAQNGVLGP